MQTSYNASLSKTGKEKGPFLYVATAAGRMTGEVTPKSTVVVRTQAGEVAAVVEGHEWHADADDVVEVRATLDGRTTVIADIAAGASSHRQSLQAPVN